LSSCFVFSKAGLRLSACLGSFLGALGVSTLLAHSGQWQSEFCSAQRQRFCALAGYQPGSCSASRGHLHPLSHGSLPPSLKPTAVTQVIFTLQISNILFRLSLKKFFMVPLFLVTVLPSNRLSTHSHPTHSQSSINSLLP
jgi:hypothetical protein